MGPYEVYGKLSIAVVHHVRCDHMHRVSPCMYRCRDICVHLFPPVFVFLSVLPLFTCAFCWALLQGGSRPFIELVQQRLRVCPNWGGCRVITCNDLLHLPFRDEPVIVLFNTHCSRIRSSLHLSPILGAIFDSNYKVLPPSTVNNL